MTIALSILLHLTLLNDCCKSVADFLFPRISQARVSYYMDNFTDKLRSAIKKAGSIANLAVKIGVSRMCIHSWLKGTRPTRSHEKLVELFTEEVVPLKSANYIVINMKDLL